MLKITLKEILGNKEFVLSYREKSNEPDWIKAGWIKQKFKHFVWKYNLKVFEEAKTLIASDETGEIRFKQVLDFEWFQWKPYRISAEETAKEIFKLL